ncbi:Tripartite-type tricarboxylate transporter, receptor component TctC [Polaromonas sp. OV174]|uniref:Bug family tripartite tricarboxylate transporter substrate binding protein n=1 Tax=Polaromonas sp. OV174 TaxID=1855300 RepID=UPI0008EA24A5|nr:tripartite tricarboxylate transporter substrate binding protein [Polaromonas sp. OV174]SFC59820.1 Tripartite-type tricarboxylate transporter, receptor component TctC [Polaromonas sp. OV174]
MFKRLLWSTLLVCTVAAPLAFADTAFPSKPVRIIVPQTPGGASDALARIVGQKLGEKWGQPVIIENRPGAGGNVGMEAVIASAPDGYVLLMSYVGTQAINGALYRKLPFDPVNDFAPVATLATLPFVMVAKADAPFRTVPELIDAARKSRIAYGSAGNGSVNHLLGEMFNAAANVKLAHIPYRGAAPALQDLMGGQIQLVFTSLPSVAGALKSGGLHPIAVTSARRASAFAGIPTIAEAGFKNFDVNPWFGLMAPKRTPRELILKINKDVNEILRSPEIVASFAAQGAEPYVTPPDDFARVLQADAVKWGEVVRASGAQVD